MVKCHKLLYNLTNNQELKKSKTVKDLGTQYQTWRLNINPLSTNATSFANWTIKSMESDVLLYMYRS